MKGPSALISCINCQQISSMRGMWKARLPGVALDVATTAGRHGAGSQTTRRFVRIGEMGVGPVVDHLVPAGVLFVARQPIGHQRRDDRLVLRPPELHVVPVLLHRQALHVDEVGDAAVLPSQPRSHIQSRIVRPV